MKKHMTAHKKGLMYCKVCKKAFDQRDHKDEHEDSHIISSKRYKCTEKLPDDMICGCQYKAWGSLHTHITIAHHKKLSEARYLKNEDVTWETLDQFRAQTRPKEPVGTYQIKDAPTK